MADQYPKVRRLIFFAGLVIYGITAYNSQGFHQADEHFQILEPTLKITQNRPVKELPWEFPAKMRPSGQIWMTVAYQKIAQGLGIENRFTQVTLLRVLTAILAFFLLWRLTQNLTSNLQTGRARILAFASVAFLWFMPYLHSRYSSELISTLAFVGGINLLFTAHSVKSRAWFFHLAAGFFICAAFWLRFQIAFAILPLVAYLILARPSWQFHLGFGTATFPAKIKPLALLLAGAITCSGIAIAADRAFYGETVLTAWNYFSENLLQGKAATFGVSPWWGYFRSFFKAATQPIALTILLAVVLFLVRNRFSFITWIFITFLGIHFAISHKELRFIFPLAVFVPAIIASAADRLFTGESRYPTVVRILRLATLSLLLGINLAALMMSSVLPADSQVAALKTFSDITGKTSVAVSDDSRAAIRVGSDPFVFFAPSLPATLFSTGTIVAANKDGEYRIVLAEKAPLVPTGCEVLRQSWWYALSAHIPEDIFYRDRFSGYSIQKCQQK